MDLLLTSVIAIGAFGIGALCIWILRTRDLGEVASKFASLEAETNHLRVKATEIDATRAANLELEKKLASAITRVEATTIVEVELAKTRQHETELATRNAELSAQLAGATAAHEEQVSQLTKMRDEIQSQFKLLAGEVLKINSEDFARRADEIFKIQRDLTATEIDKRSKDLSDLIKPLGDSLRSYDVALKEIETSRIQGFSAIDTTLQLINAQHSEVRTDRK